MNTLKNSVERWRKSQRQKHGERLYNGSKMDLRKFFRPKQWHYGHLSQLEGKLFTVIWDKKRLSLYVDPYLAPALYWLSKRNDYLGRQERKILPSGDTVMATGNACKRTKQAGDSYEFEEGARFVEVLTTNGVGYVNMRFLHLAKE